MMQVYKIKSGVHKDELQWHDVDGYSFACDICGVDFWHFELRASTQMNSSEDPSYRCDQCNFDACEACAEKSELSFFLSSVFKTPLGF